MTKAIFATIGLMLILSTNIFGQPQRPHNRKKPSGLITEFEIPSSAVKANSTKPNKARKGTNAAGVNWHGPDLDADSNPMTLTKRKTIKHRLTK